MTSPEPRRPRVLFLCTANSCRSQMAEAWLRHLTAGRVEALSAGTEPSRVNPLAARVLEEAGLDLAGQRSKSVEAFLPDPPDLVVSVCANAERACPSFPGSTTRLHWPFDDPAAATGSDDEVLAEFRRVRDEIRERIEAWLADGLPPLG